MKEILLTKNQVALVDDDDFEKVSQYKWYAAKQKSKFRAATKGGRLLMHRLIMDVTDTKILVDHIDTNPLNNQKENLRLCSVAENNKNRKAFKNNKTNYKGVFYRADRKKFVANICVNKKQIRIGSYNTALEAANAYDSHVKKLHGQYAQTSL